jgi:hypothetical protein
MMITNASHTLRPVACERALEWTLALNKPVLPVTMEQAWVSPAIGYKVRPHLPVTPD